MPARGKALPGRDIKNNPTKLPRSKTGPNQSPSHYQISHIVAFSIFLVPALLAAIYSPIQDCDETFNYWEPTHYLRHGYGLQTWEYSPEYAIRSWLYVSIHALVGVIASLMPFINKMHEFYATRVILASACAASEVRLYRSISRTVNPRVGIMFMICMTISPGMFHASVAYLPSTFAMCSSMLGMAAFMDWRGGLKTAQGITWFGIAGIVGWPFAIALSIPFLIEEAGLAIISKAAFALAVWRILDGIARCLAVLALGFAVDLIFYRRAEIVPLNIVLYNIFSGPGKGPDIFGTEPWHFYTRNLALNFNVWFLLALIALPLVILQLFVRAPGSSLQTRLRTIVFISPFYLWFGIFSLQPHKEERFMFPAYPALALNASMSLHILLSWIGSSDPKALIGRLPAKLKLLAIGALLLSSLGIGVLRILGVVTAYSAPFRVHKSLQGAADGSANGNICYGKEWYRFPSSYFLPNNMRAKFIMSEFNGLLPGEFRDTGTRFGDWSTWSIPAGMNDENREDLGKYTNISLCTYLVDSYFPGSEATKLEPHYLLDQEDTWARISCTSFLDVSRTGMLGRILWIPDISLIPSRFRRKWGQYCLLRRKDRM